MTVELSAPIFIIGTHRSGTSFLGDALAQHPDVDYWPEPRHVWSWRNNFRPDDRLSAADATPKIKEHIRGRFARHLAESGRTRFAEKTPNSCLRLPFIHEIFPDARFVHIFRDGRAVVASTLIMNRTRIPHPRWYPVRLLGTPVWEWPAFLPRAWRTLGRRMLGLDMAFWGPQPPGWREWLNEDQLVGLAKQWRYTAEPALDFSRQVESSRWLDIRYEDLVRRPAEFVEPILRVTGLRESDALERFLVSESDATRVDHWHSSFSEADLERLRPILEPTMTRLGYSW